MKTLSIRQMRAALSRLEEVLGREGEILIVRRGQALARLLPLRAERPFPSHADLRATMPRLKVPSEALVRRDRDAR